MNLAVELVSMTPGLYLGTEQLSSPGDMWTIGSEADLSLTPIFWTDAEAAPGHYAAEFKLVDLSGTYADSGTINFDFAVVPEPSSASLLLISAATLGLLTRRRPKLCVPLKATRRSSNKDRRVVPVEARVHNQRSNEG